MSREHPTTPWPWPDDVWVLMLRYALLWTRYAMLVALERLLRLLRLSRP